MLRHHQDVVIVMRDARRVAERLTHAMAEGVDRRAEGEDIEPAVPKASGRL